MQNLISNAIKYNLPQGWINIQAYQQASMAWVVEGTGLGLNLSREIARAHGGDLTLDSTPSGQTSFTLRLVAESSRRKQTGKSINISD